MMYTLIEYYICDYIVSGWSTTHTPLFTLFILSDKIQLVYLSVTSNSSSSCLELFTGSGITIPVSCLLSSGLDSWSMIALVPFPYSIQPSLRSLKASSRDRNDVKKYCENKWQVETEQQAFLAKSEKHILWNYISFWSKKILCWYNKKCPQNSTECNYRSVPITFFSAAIISIAVGKIAAVFALRTDVISWKWIIFCEYYSQNPNGLSRS